MTHCWLVVVLLSIPDLGFSQSIVEPIDLKLRGDGYFTATSTKDWIKLNCRDYVENSLSSDLYLWTADDALIPDLSETSAEIYLKVDRKWRFFGEIELHCAIARNHTIVTARVIVSLGAEYDQSKMTQSESNNSSANLLIIVAVCSGIVFLVMTALCYCHYRVKHNARLSRIEDRSKEIMEVTRSYLNKRYGVASSG